MPSSTLSPSAAQDIRHRMLGALARSRTPGFHFPGYLLQLAWPHIGATSITETMPAWTHACDAHGEISLAALGVILDTALATAPRLKIATGARQATVQLHAQFTGHPPSGDLSMEAVLEGFSDDGSVRQALTSRAACCRARASPYATPAAPSSCCRRRWASSSRRCPGNAAATQGWNRWPCRNWMPANAR